MPSRPSVLDAWSPEQVSRGREWVAAWKRAGSALAEVRLRELRNLDTFAAIALLYGADEHSVLRLPSPTSGLIEQQRLFRKFFRA
jgi:hypothetical protein